MTFYYDFENRRWHASVYWPKDATSLNVELTDTQITRYFPSDLIFEVRNYNIVTYIVEDKANKRLCELQKAICKRLQEYANQM